MQLKFILKHTTKVLGILSFFMCVALLSSSPVNAASDDYRFAHGDQNVLVIGEITAIKNGQLKVKTHYFIQSTSPAFKKEQLYPEEFSILIDSIYIPECNKYNVGDYILASLDKTEQENVYKDAWGVYIVSEPNPHTMEFLTEIDDYRKAFIRSAVLYKRGLDPYTLSSKYDYENPIAVVYPASYHEELPMKIEDNSFAYSTYTVILVLITGVVVFLLTKKKYQRR